MKIVNILKDGTVIEDLSKVTVPADTVKRVCAIANGEGRANEKKSKKHNH